MVSKKDEQIIEILQSDSRLPVSEIARKIGMSENGVRYRLEKLENAGYIQSYTVLLNTKKFDRNVTAIFNINTTPKKTTDVIHRLQEMDELQVIYKTSGVYSLMIIGLFRSIDELNVFIEEKLADADIIESTVDVVTKKLKETHFSI